MRILLLEDEFMLRKNIAKYLRLKGHIVDEFEDGKTLIEEAQLIEYDFFLLDINTPNFNGFEIMEYIKSKKLDTPVIFISSMTDVKDISKGFGLGCSDYLKKPFELEELDIRIAKAADTKKVDELLLLSDSYSYSIAKKQLYQNDEPVQIPKTPARILYVLAKNAGKIVTFDEIIEYVYPGEAVSPSTIVGRIRDLRKYISSNLIQNIHAEGYKLMVR